MASLPGIMMLLATLLTVRWRSRYTTSVSAQVWPSLGSRLMFVLPVLTPVFPRSWQPIWLIVSMTLVALPRGIADSITLSLMRESVLPQAITALLSRRQMALNLSIAIGSAGFGFWLEEVRFPVNYQIMFGGAFALSLVSFWHLNQTRPIVASTAEKQITSLRQPWQDARFRGVALMSAVVFLAFLSIVPMIPLRLVNELGASEGFVAIYGLFELAGGTVGAALTVRIVRHIGNRVMLGIAMIGTAVGVLIMALTSTLPVTLIAAVVMGATWTIADIGQFSLFSESVPLQNSTSYTTAYLQLVSICAFVGPMIGSLMTSAGVDLALVLMIGALLRLLAGLLTLKGNFVENRPHPT